MPIVIKQGPKFSAVLAPFPNPMATARASKVGRAPTGPFANYGEPNADHEAMARTLYENDGSSNNLQAEYIPRRNGIDVLCRKTGQFSSESAFFTLGRFLPYLPFYKPSELNRTIKNAVNASNQGAMNMWNGGGIKELQSYANMRVNKHLAETNKDEPSVLRLTIKTIGLGTYGSDFEVAANALLTFPSMLRIPENCSIDIRCIGFDICFGVLGQSYEGIRDGLGTAWNQTILRDRIRITYESYWGNLLDRSVLNYMLAFGPADITMVRRTHALNLPKCPLGASHALLSGIKKASARPGLLIIQEGRGQYPALDRQEILK